MHPFIFYLNMNKVGDPEIDGLNGTVPTRIAAHWLSTKCTGLPLRRPKSGQTALYITRTSPYS